jgi:hypothetical protein
MTKEQKINAQIAEGCDTNLISDGYHTFGELYEHRITLYIALCRKLPKDRVWRTQTHSDGSVLKGWFVLGVDYKAGEQITYHLPMSKWQETDFAETLVKSPEYDGHTSKDVLQRLSEI